MLSLSLFLPPSLSLACSSPVFPSSLPACLAGLQPAFPRTCTTIGKIGGFAVAVRRGKGHAWEICFSQATPTPLDFFLSVRLFNTRVDDRASVYIIPAAFRFADKFPREFADFQDNYFQGESKASISIARRLGRTPRIRVLSPIKVVKRTRAGLAWPLVGARRIESEQGRV